MWTQMGVLIFFLLMRELCCFKRPFLLIQNEKMPSDSRAISGASRYRLPLLLGITLPRRAPERPAGVITLASRLIQLCPITVSQLLSQRFLLPPR